VNKTKDYKMKGEMLRILKIESIKKAIRENNLHALIVGIRWDEHEARSNEKYFSKREDHIRVHPILHFTETDIWNYIRTFNVPYNPLYDKGFRSLGEKGFTKPVLNPNAPERSGRERDKEEIMKRLRALGYF
jgi:phosphoadenosine phosphosulfate reductase